MSGKELREMGGSPLIAAPLRLEQLAIKLGARGLRTCHTGMGEQRSKQALEPLRRDAAAALVVMGVCGGLEEHCEPGEVVIAEHLIDGERPDASALQCPSAQPLAEALQRRGIAARCATIVSVARIAHGDERVRLRELGAAVVDMESTWLAAAAAGRPFAVIRIVADTPSREVTRPLMTLVSALRAALSLRHTAATLEGLVRDHGVRAVLGDGDPSE